MADITFKDLQDSVFKDNQSTSNAQAYNTEQKAVTDTKDSAIASAKKIAASSYSDADILNQKLAKYIPNYLASQGVNGGLSETYALKANSGLQNLYANINNTLESTKQSALETYNTNMVTAKANDETLAYSDYTNELNSLASDSATTAKQYSDLWDKYKNELGNNSQTAWNELQSTIKGKSESGEITDNSLKINGNGTYSITGNNYTKDNFITNLTELSKSFSQGNKQSDYISALTTYLQGKVFSNGDVINLNYGLQTNTSGYYVYYDGNFYQLSSVTDTIKDKQQLPEGYETRNHDIRKK